VVARGRKFSKKEHLHRLVVVVYNLSYELFSIIMCVGWACSC